MNINEQSDKQIPQTLKPIKPTPEVGGLEVWEKMQRIPGTTRVPLVEIAEHVGFSPQNLTVLDLGSGEGRSTEVLNQAFSEKRGNTIVALDLSHTGLRKTSATEFKIQAEAENLPTKEQVFDIITVCGVMTNLVDRDPEASVALREQVLTELFRALKPGGLAAISDFGAEHLFDDYDVNYRRHELITQEPNTIAVLKKGQNFVGKTDEEVAALRNTDAIERFAHHYTGKELIALCEEAGFEVLKLVYDITETPKGKKKIENIILIARKPQNS